MITLENLSDEMLAFIIKASQIDRDNCPILYDSLITTCEAELQRRQSGEDLPLAYIPPSVSGDEREACLAECLVRSEAFRVYEPATNATAGRDFFINIGDAIHGGVLQNALH